MSAGEIEAKKAKLEQQYISLLEQRVAELEKVVKTSKTDQNNNQETQGTLENGDENEAAKDEAKSPTSVVPLTKENLDKVVNGTSKTDGTKNKERVRYVVSKYNEKSGSREEISLEKANLNDSGKDSECLLRNVMQAADPRKISHNEIDLGQGALLDLMKEVLADDIADQISAGSHITFYTPFISLVHKWDRLEEEANLENEKDTVERKQARSDLKKVLEFVQRSQKLESYFKTRSSNRSSGVVHWDYLWTIYPTGVEVVVSTFLDEKQIMRVGDPPYLYNEEKTQSMWCWYYDHDGTNWKVAEIEFEIDRFAGTRPIEALPCIPLEYYKENGEKTDLAKLKSNLAQRGKRFKDLCTANPGVQQMFDYKGPLLSVEKPFRSQYSNDSQDDQNTYRSLQDRKPESDSFKKASVDGRILVDPKSFLEHSPVAEFFVGDRRAYIIETKEKKHDISDEQKILTTPPRVLGWSTTRKLWCEFRVTEVKAAEKGNPRIFEEELQLDPKVKKMIKALVEQHNRNDASDDVTSPDLIAGKGLGLVIMLHGPPGVGKTLTAEAIAEKTGRPLLIVSVAEIGLNASRAERNLERLFQLASRWQAILLVDEADVFLEARVSSVDPNRNALVSVLLRVLEYYQGIMILTTNRINSLDVAVQSRIHLAVRFDDLSEEQMLSILKTILKKFKVNSKDIDNIIDNFKEWIADDSGLRFNGRQIRNLVFSAHAMALSEKRDSINFRDIKEVLRVTRQFQNQLKEVIRNQRANREASKGTD